MAMLVAFDMAAPGRRGEHDSVASLTRHSTQLLCINSGEPGKKHVV